MSDIAIEAMETGADFFIDPEETTEETTEETAGETQTEESAEEQPEPQEQKGATPEAKPEGLTIKYNHEERTITLEEAKELAEKGMALDKTRAELEAVRSGREFKVLDAYAQRNNMTREQYVEYLEKNEERIALREAEKAVRQKYPGLTDEAAKEMAQLKIAQESQKRQLEDKAKEEQARRMQQEESVRDWSDFLREYPDLNTADKIPAEVQEAVRQGERPLSAMRKYELAKAREETEALRAQMEAKEKTKEKNAQNRKTAMTSVTETREMDGFDAFAAGFLKG